MNRGVQTGKTECKSRSESVKCDKKLNKTRGK